MKISNYGIKTTTINSCINVFTIKVRFRFNNRLIAYLRDTCLKEHYCIVMDKNGYDHLHINYATTDSNQFAKICEDFAKISLNNKLDKMLDKTNILSKTEISNILISKCAFNV